MNKNQINWEEYRKDLVSSLSNERIWAIGCTGYNPHVENIVELETEIKSIDKGDYDAVIKMHEDIPGFFNDFLLANEILKKIAQRLNNLDYISLGNEFCILFQGLITPLSFDYKRILKEWNHAEGDFSQWYEHLLLAERERLIDYYTNKHIL